MHQFEQHFCNDGATTGILSAFARLHDIAPRRQVAAARQK
jgi:hypothetical protein